jgi:hypothetical protein
MLRCRPLGRCAAGPSHHGTVGGSAGPWGGSVQAGLRHDGKGAVYSCALGPHHRRANVLPRAAPGQLRNALLEAAVKDKPAVAVPQGQCQELVH